jgi:hypothetical protein
MKKSWTARCEANPNLLFSKAIANAKKRSKEKGLVFEIDINYIKELYSKQSGKCYYSKLPLNIVKNQGSGLHDSFKMTLDRLDPEKGYVKGNVVWCAYCINSFKLNMSKDKIVEVCKAIINNFNEKEENKKDV